MSEDRFKQKVREALRSEEDGLSPGFYTRTVARFKAERRRPPFGLTWSTIGLAAATIVAALIFIPAALRDELPMPESTPVRVEHQPPATEATETETEERAAAKQDKLVALPEQAREQAPPPGRESRQDAPIVTDPDVTFEDLGSDDANEQTRLEEHVVAPLPEKRRVVLPAPSEPADLKSAGEGSTENDEVDFAEEPPVAGGLLVSRPVVTELPDGAVGVGEIELLDTIPTPDRLTASEEKLGRSTLANSAHALSKVAPTTRFVAIGRRPGLDACAALSLRLADQAWEIDYADSGSSTGKVTCGVEIPDDGREIRFQGWPIDE